LRTGRAVIAGLLAIAVCVLASGQSDAESIVWQDAAIDDLSIVFRGDALGLRPVLIKKTTSYQLNKTVEYSTWTGPSRYAIAHAEEAFGGMVFRGLGDVRPGIARMFSYLKSKNLVWGETRGFGSRLGYINVHFLRANNEHCMVWGFLFGDESVYGSRGRAILMYCQPDTIAFDFAKKVALLSGHKSGYVPPKMPEKLATAKPASPSDAGWRTVPFAASWEGRDDLLSGVLKYQDDKGRGALEAATGEVTCRGQWQFVSGTYGTSDPPTGTWSIACTDGRAASGTYVSDRLGKGVGRGTDAEGRAVKITYGGG
jgi:hypothetical protein